MRITTNEKYSCWTLLGGQTFWTCSKLLYWPAEATRMRRTLFELIVIVIARMTRNDQEWSPEQTRIVNSCSFGSRFGPVGLGHQLGHSYMTARLGHQLGHSYMTARLGHQKTDNDKYFCLNDSLQNGAERLLQSWYSC